MTDTTTETPAPNGTGGEDTASRISGPGSLFEIFFDPGAVFEDIRKKPFPRLLMPLFLCALAISAFNFSLAQKLGPERIMREQLKSAWMAQIPDDQKEKMVEQAKSAGAVQNAINNTIGIVVIVVIFVIIGLVYWGLGLAFGGEGSFLHGLAISAYASFPITIISMIGSIVILLLKDADDISFFDAQQGMLKLNPTILLDAGPVLSGLMSRIDVLAIWGMFLGAIGLQKCFRISSGSAWAISIVMWLIGTGFVVLGKMFSS
jgi:hypothetical protein